METEEITLAGKHGDLVTRVVRNPGATHLVVIAHGYGEHGGRYDHVARHLAGHRATVVIPDHHGHGRSAGERVLATDFDDFVADLHTVLTWAKESFPGLPAVLVGHSMGGLIAARYAQVHGAGLAGLALSGPIVGGNPAFQALADMDPMPEVPIDPAQLSRDRAVGEAYAADPLVWHGPFKATTLKALIACVERLAAGPALGDLPLLWLHGGDDAIVPLEINRSAVYALRGPDFEEHVYAGAAHEIFNETNKDEVLGDLSGFIRRVTTAGRN